MQKLYKINIEGEEYHVGYPASALVGQLEEELETMRTENASIKYNLTIAYMDGYAKAQEKIRGLEAENAKLIAERDSTIASFKNFHRLLCDRFDYSHDPIDWRRDQISLIEHIANQHKEAAFTVCALRAEIDEYQAEREAMMKQEPIARAFKNSMTGTSSEIYLLREIPEGETNLYASPLPAQQMPEGYKFENKKGHIVVTCQDQSQEIIYADEPLFELISMLSASQPKGDM